MSDMLLNRVLWIGAASLMVLTGCVGTKGITKPRSEVISEAHSEGVPVTEVDEDRDYFFANEKNNQEKLISLLKSRISEGEGDNSYVIGPGDDVQISVFDVPELNTTVKVAATGTIDLPLVGLLPAAGKTEAQLLTALKAKMRVFVRNPQVTLALSHYGSQKVSLLGAVQKPGSYSLKKGANTITELISSAGGVTEKAGNFLNFVPAENNPSSNVTPEDIETRARLSLGDFSGEGASKRQGLELYLDQVLGTNGGIPIDIPIRAGDMIIVPEGGKIMVEGEVEKPGATDLGQRMTLLSALAASGGITYAAKADEVEVVRDIGERKVHLVVDLEKLARGEGKDVRLRNGDVVRVPSDSGRRMKQDTFESITKIFNFGVGSSVPIK